MYGNVLLTLLKITNFNNINALRNYNNLKSEIEKYIISYIFQRFEINSLIDFKSETRTIQIKDLQIKIPEIPASDKPFELSLFGVQVPYYRYNDKILLQGSEKEKKLTYDIIGEVYDHLTLVYEKERGITTQSELVFYPLMDMKIHNLFLQLKEFVPLKYKTFKGKDFLLGVSHDIDRTGDSFRYRMMTYFFQTLKQKRPLLFFKGVLGKNEETNFEYIIEKEKEFNTNSTWFILTRYGLKLNADYHLKDKEFRKALKLLNENNREIGIHIPYMDLELTDIQKEFAKVEYPEKMGMRMHHLRGNYEDLLKILNKAVIKYDSTFGHNECIAFRFGTSIPFYPIVNDEILENIYEIPLNIMDLQITDAEKYRDQLQKLFTILHEVKGVCIINWHNNRFNKTKYGNIWVDTFNISLEEATKNNALLTNISNILTFFK